MTPNKRLQNLVSAERDKRAVVWVWAVVIEVVRVRSVLKAVGICVGINAISLLFRHHFPQIPELSGLVLAVAKYVSPITLAVDIR